MRLTARGMGARVQEIGNKNGRERSTNHFLIMPPLRGLIILRMTHLQRCRAYGADCTSGCCVREFGTRWNASLP
jgi:hypothetical protein